MKSRINSITTMRRAASAYIPAALALAACLGTSCGAQTVSPSAEMPATEPTGATLQQGFVPQTTQNVGALTTADGHWEARVADPAVAIGVHCVDVIGIFPSAESKVGSRSVGVAYEAVRKYPPLGLPLSEVGKQTAVGLSFLFAKPIDLSGKQEMTFWIRISDVKPVLQDTMYVNIATDRYKNTKQVLSYTKLQDGWQEIHVPLPSGKGPNDPMMTSVDSIGIQFPMGSPDVYTWMFWIDGLQFN